jgi:opacity protein-like surface antigen
MRKLISLISLSLITTMAHAVSPHVGASVGYLFDAKEPIYSARAGVTLFEWAGIDHGVEVEIGTSSSKEGIFNIDMRPLMFNYRGELALTERLFAYFGAGAGTVHFDVNYGTRGGDGDGFAWQAFGGMGIRLADYLALTGGVRFLDVSDIKIRGQEIGSENDVELGLGVQFTF